jgi:hypothetical protein
MSRITDPYSEVKSRDPIVIGGWLTVRNGRVIGTPLWGMKDTRDIIQTSARENRVSVAEVDQALIAYAAAFGRQDIVFTGDVIDWWRKTQLRRRAA